MTGKQEQKGVYPLPNILDSLSADVRSGRISLRDAAQELCVAGWTNFVDQDRTKILLKLEV